MRWLCHVLHARRQVDPGVHAFFVHGESRGRKPWIGKGAHGHSNVVFVIAFDCIVNRATAFGAETENYLTFFVTDPNVLTRFAADGDCAPLEPCLCAEDASCSALACEAVTDGHSDLLGSRGERQLSAATRGCSGIHAVAVGKSACF